MRPARLFYRPLFSLFAALLFAACAVAQSPVDPGNLPGNTLLYLAWHGYPSADIRKNNSLLALWDDPDFAVARASFVDSVLTDSAKQKGKPTLSREDFEKYITLLDNPFVVGFVRQRLLELAHRRVRRHGEQALDD